MKFSIIFSLLFLLAGIIVQGEARINSIDKSAFYTAIASSNEELINAQLTTVKASSIAEKEAYEGALLMKKAGVIKGTAKEKLSLFKAGRTKLEAAIAKDKDNIEYRFLRLIIQENAPKIVKYKSEIEADSLLVRTNFKSLPQNLQTVITDYSKTSKALKN